MIDWIKAIIPLQHDTMLSSGQVFSISIESGEIEWSVVKRLAVEGSHDAKVHVKTYDVGFIMVDGNPAKFLQGHNIYGTNDLNWLCFHFFMKVAHCLKLEPTEADMEAWLAGEYELKRVDVTESFRLPSQADVPAWLLAAGSTVRGKHQSTSAYAGETIYIGKNSRRISLKLYSKYLELQKHKLPKTLPLKDKLLEHSKGLLRAEVRILGMELKRRGLNRGSHWISENTPYEIVKERVMNMKLNQKFRLSQDEQTELPPRLMLVYSAWSKGDDVRAIVPKSSFYRYRAELLEHGVDISAPPPKAGEVIPLIRYLTADHINEVPNELQNSEIYFFPKKAVG